MRQLFAVALFIMCVKAFALRCGTELIDVGSTGDDVLSKCRVSSVYVTRNNNADITKITIKEGAVTTTFTVIDGVFIILLAATPFVGFLVIVLLRLLWRMV